MAQVRPLKEGRVVQIPPLKKNFEIPVGERVNEYGHKNIYIIIINKKN